MIPIPIVTVPVFYDTRFPVLYILYYDVGKAYIIQYINAYSTTAAGLGLPGSFPRKRQKSHRGATAGATAGAKGPSVTECEAWCEPQASIQTAALLMHRYRYRHREKAFSVPSIVYGLR